MLAGRWLYRSRQFWAAVAGTLGKEELDEAKRVLGPRLFALFAEMPAQYRYHGYAVYGRVRASGCEEQGVWRAALLHDMGKYDPTTRRFVSVWHRVAIVLLRAVAPGRNLYLRLAAAGGAHGPEGVWGLLIYPFYLSRHHAQLGAQRAIKFGATPALAELIASHHHAAQTPALAALQMADERS